MHAAGLAVLTTGLALDHALALDRVGVDFIEADDAGLLSEAVGRSPSVR